MIQINKRSPPIILINRKKGTDRLKQATNDIVAKYNSNPPGYDSGIDLLEFDSKIYAHDKIKELLISIQHYKCAFCESSNIQYGDIEHFRPKGGFKQNEKDKLNKPGYYWLAYDWDNFYFTCQICNQHYKKNLFPIRNCERRAKNHNSNYGKEKPFFVNPGKENPKHIIGFRGSTAYGKDKNHRGKITIEGMGLNRNDFGDLTEIRKDILNPILFAYKVSKLPAPTADFTLADINEAKELMKYCRSRKHQFSSMIQDNCPL
jgi:hypothetical protein